MKEVRSDMANPNPSESVPFHPSEHQTNARFSLANHQIGSLDYLIHHPTGNQRAITYPSPNTLHLTIRDKLYESGLVLGRLVTDDNETGYESFIVPDSARPLAYDASSRASGAFSYNDAKLFNELGNLFALASLAVDERFIFDDDIRHGVAIVEFTKPGERKLLFVPGAEQFFVPARDGLDPAQFYSDQLAKQFGRQFIEGSVLFRSGYDNTRSHGLRG